MGKFLCYTTVFDAIGLLAGAVTGRERSAMMDAMGGLRVLGLNAKHAVGFAELFRRYPGKGALDLLVAGQCRESGLPLLTRKRSAFAGIAGLTLLTPDDILRGTGTATLSRRTRSTR